MTTRAVSKAADVQPPTIYRIFGDMQGLLDAVAAEGFAEYLTKKTSRARAADAVDDLREGWDLHIEFGLSHPEVYKLMYGQPRPGIGSDAARDAFSVLQDLVERVAEAGKLRIDVDRAAQMIHSAGTGVTLTLIGTEPEERDPELSRQTREAILTAVTISDAPERPSGYGKTTARAVALKAVLPELTDTLTPAERGLLAEWLDRIAATA